MGETYYFEQVRYVKIDMFGTTERQRELKETNRIIKKFNKWMNKKNKPRLS